MRVLTNFSNKHRFDAAIVIPSREEGRNILPTLAGWAMQCSVLKNPESPQTVRAAVFVVINNTRDDRAEVRASNQETHDLLQYLIDRGQDAHGETTLKQASPSEVDLEIFQLAKVLSGPLPLALIDLWSEDHALESCNVGIARDKGVQVALEYLEDDGFFVMTDADTTPLRGYLRAAFDYLQGNNRVAALCGKVYIEKASDHETKKRNLLYSLYHDLNALVEKSLLVYCDVEPRKLSTHLSGGNSVIRKQAMIEVGGVPHLPGAEDVELGRRIQEIAGPIARIENLNVTTSMRISRRTDASHGMGQCIAQLAPAIDQPWDCQVLPFDAMVCIAVLNREIPQANRSYEPEELWKSRLKEAVREVGKVLSEEQLQELWDNNRIAPRATGVERNRLLWAAIRRVAEAQYGTVSLSELGKRLIQHIRTQEVLQERPIEVPALTFDQDGLDPMKYLETTTKELGKLSSIVSYRQQRMRMNRITSCTQRLCELPWSEPPFNLTEVKKLVQALEELAGELFFSCWEDEEMQVQRTLEAAERKNPPEELRPHIEKVVRHDIRMRMKKAKEKLLELQRDLKTYQRAVLCEVETFFPEQRKLRYTVMNLFHWIQLLKAS